MENEVIYPFWNDAVFCKVLERDPEIAKKIMILAAGKELEGINLDSLTVEKQEPFDPKLDSKSIRLDVYMKGYQFYGDLEMQTSPEAFALRSRYYISINDVDNLQKGSKYRNLPKAIVVFICVFDPFKDGLARYVAKERLYEDDDCKNDITEQNKYDAKYVKIFLNTKYTVNNVSGELANLLDYVDTNIPKDAFTEKVDDMVKTVNIRDREFVMTLQEKLDEKHIQGIVEGEKLGLSKGLRALITSLRPFFTNDEEVFKAVISNEDYKNTSFEEFRNILKSIEK